MARQQDIESGRRPVAPSDAGANGYREDWVLPRVGIAEAARRHWIIVLLAVILGLAAAAAIGLARKPTYTADARVSVQRNDVGVPGNVTGYVAATQELASAYGRAATSTQVTEPVAKRVGISGEEVRSRVSAAPIAESPVLTISADGSSSADAVELANAMSDSLSRYVVRINRPRPSPDRLLAEYRAAAVEVNEAEKRLARVSDRFTQGGLTADRSLLDAAEADQQAAQTRRDALGERYRLAVQTQADVQLQVLNPASSADSDRFQILQILLFAGLIAGLAVGLALAVLQSNRALRRSLA
jgi:capsular polysaccharide biosynthesis protein